MFFTDPQNSRARPLARAGRGLLLMALLVCAGACGSDQEPPSPGAREFRRQALETLERLSGVFAGPVARGDHQAAAERLREVFAGAEDEGRPFPLGVTLLDRRGRLVCSRFPLPGRPGGEATCPLLDYAGYQHYRRVMEEGEVVARELFTSRPVGGSRSVYVLCGPLGDEPAGVLCLSYSREELERRGVTPREFLELDYGAP